jgi:TPR repeat protein
MRGINLKSKAHGLFICGLLLSGNEAIGSPQQDKFDAGLAALERQHYATAVRAWSEIAILGSPTAQNNLGLLYEQGLGVTQNFVSAMEWYERAEEAGSLEAAHNIGMLYVNGRAFRRVGQEHFIIFLRQRSIYQTVDTWWA